ncbi:MAG: hypothetical protein GXP59_06630 [Deltaproteobacteria bacterium]|nr:hypothetical protein [Deltaproteobacteria bacterium]
MKWLITALIFFVILAGHFIYSVPTATSTTTVNGQWASYRLDLPPRSRLSRYMQAGDYWLGLSYALAGGFAAFCLLRAVRRRRQTIISSTGGIALSGLLWAGVCFFTGCCGSPMLPIYLGLLGPKFIGVTKPLTFAITILSIFIGVIIMFRRPRSKMHIL